MASNPKWCQPLSVWKQYFSNWIHAAGAEDLLQASIFFDFGTGFGHEELVEELRSHLFGAVSSWSGFLRHLTENALHFKPPLGFFRNFVVESKGAHRNSFDIKQAMQPIVDFARIYALKHGVRQTNTLDRIYQLYLCLLHSIYNLARMASISLHRGLAGRTQIRAIMRGHLSAVREVILPSKSSSDRNAHPQAR